MDALTRAPLCLASRMALGHVWRLKGVRRQGPPCGLQRGAFPPTILASTWGIDLL